MTISSTPDGVTVKPRHLRFDVRTELRTLWHGNDAFRTAFFNALSLQFPDGEQQFINAVRLYRDQITDPKLKEEIKGFIGQEALHSREHKAENSIADKRTTPYKLCGLNFPRVVQRHFAKRRDEVPN